MGGGRRAVYVDVKCDYCGKIYSELYSLYKTKANKTKIPKDSCCDCYQIKARETINTITYKDGYPDEFREKARNTSIKKYGYACHTQREEYKDKYLYGSNNPSYKNGMGKMYREGTNDKCHAWRKLVLSRDKFKCIVCGDYHRLEAHHINNFKDFPEERNNVDNGATLCHKCHKEFHMKYGYFKITRKEFIEWLNDNICND